MLAQVVRTIARPAVQRFSAPACRSLATYYGSSHEYIKVLLNPRRISREAFTTSAHSMQLQRKSTQQCSLRPSRY